MDQKELKQRLNKIFLLKGITDASISTLPNIIDEIAELFDEETTSAFRRGADARSDEIFDMMSMTKCGRQMMTEDLGLGELSEPPVRTGRVSPPSGIALQCSECGEWNGHFGNCSRI